MREPDYRPAFERTERLFIVEWRTEFTEGEDLLTPEIGHEPQDYDTEELTKRSIIVVVQKKT